MRERRREKERDIVDDPLPHHCHLLGGVRLIHLVSQFLHTQHCDIKKNLIIAILTIYSIYIYSHKRYFAVLTEHSNQSIQNNLCLHKKKSDNYYTLLQQTKILSRQLNCSVKLADVSTRSSTRCSSHSEHLVETSASFIKQLSDLQRIFVCFSVRLIFQSHSPHQHNLIL